MHHQYHRHLATSIKDTGANFATGTAGVVDTNRKFPTVIMTPVANSGNNIRLLAP